jgi:hypothetical protein
MKKLALLLLPLFVAGPAIAGGPRIRGQRNVYHEEHCYKNVENYTPGYYDDYGNYRRGRVRVTRKEVPCRRIQYVPQIRHHHHEDFNPNVGGKVDDNSCVEGSVIGGILGGGAGGALAKKENWIWSIPLGVVGGAMVGCQVDGG